MERFCLRKRDNRFAHSRLSRAQPCGLLTGGRKNGRFGLLAKLVAEDTEASRGVAEKTGGLGRGHVIDEVGSKGLILSMGGIRWLQEEPSHVR